MKIFKYWQVETQKLKVDNQFVDVKCYGGSNISEDDARQMAQQKIAKIQQKVNGNPRAFENYEVEIREEIVQIINPKAIITRNRYGAQVLNVEDMMIMDIDEPKSSFMDMFKKRDPAKDKQKIVEMVRNLAKKPAYQSYSFRVYETQKGMRVIVLGGVFDPTTKEAQAMLEEFHCDQLYKYLCKRQACFRARLTPKPSRIKIRRYKVRYPRQSDEEQDLQNWLKEYEAASIRYSVCKFIEQIGTATLPEAVRIHDEITGVIRSLTLA